MASAFYLTSGVIIIVMGLVAWMLWYARKDAKKEIEIRGMEQTTEAYKNAEKVTSQPINSVDDIIAKL